MFDIVSSRPGAGANYIASLIARHNSQEKLFMYTPSNNEYRVHFKPHHLSSGENLQLVNDSSMLVYEDNEWTCFDNTLYDNVCVTRMHGEDIPEKEQENIANKCGVFYNITVEEKHDEYIRLLATYKNMINKRFYGQGYYITKIGKLHIPNIANKFPEFVRQFNKHVSVGTPMNIIPMKYFIQHFIPNNQFDPDHYMAFTREQMFKYMDKIMTSERPIAGLEDKIINVGYDDFIVNRQSTGTILDNYKSDTQEYHDTNLRLIDDFIRCYKI